MTLPNVGLMTPSRSLANVVLPLPLSPATAVIEGRSVEIANVTSSTATVTLERLKSPPPNALVTFWSSRRLANFASRHGYIGIEKMAHNVAVITHFDVSRFKLVAYVLGPTGISVRTHIRVGDQPRVAVCRVCR